MTRTLPLRVVTRSPEPGADPDAIDCAKEVYGDSLPFLEHNLTEPYHLSQTGQCEYSWRDEWTVCIHCKRESGL